jgi:hypothetical protein
VLEAERPAGIAEGERSVARAIVGHDALDDDTEACVVGDGGLEEGDGAGLSFCPHDAAEGDAGGVVDANPSAALRAGMDEFPADPAGVVLAGAVAGDAMAGSVETAELFDVDVDQLARPLALVTALPAPARSGD